MRADVHRLTLDLARTVRVYLWVEGMVRRIMERQARIATDTSSMKFALWILVAWLVLISLVTALFLVTR